MKTCHGFQDEDFTILMDDGKQMSPTLANIMAAFEKLAGEAKPGDALFCHFSGHGCSIPDDNGDEEDGMDEAMCPVDYKKAGLIRDDDIFKILVAPLPRGSLLTCVMDCCHSGSMLDLPYHFEATNEGQVCTQCMTLAFEDFTETSTHIYSCILALLHFFRRSNPWNFTPALTLVRIRKLFKLLSQLG